MFVTIAPGRAFALSSGLWWVGLALGVGGRHLGSTSCRARGFQQRWSRYSSGFTNDLQAVYDSVPGRQRAPAPDQPLPRTLNSAGQGTARLVFKTVHETFALIRLLVRAILVMDTTPPFGSARTMHR